MKRTIHIQLLLAILTLTLSFAAKAGILPTINSIKTPDSGTPAVVLTTSTAETTVTRATPSGGSHVDLFTKGIITFGVNHHYPQYFADMHIMIRVKITPYATAGGGAGSPDTITMEISYSPLDSLSFRDKQSIIIPGVEKYDAKIVYIEVDGISVTTLPANLYVNAEMFVDRYYDFTTPAGTALTTLADSEIDSDCDNHYDELLITWDDIESAEEYQLEWVYINDYDTVGTYYADTELNYDFKHNSTRISTTSSEYKISLAYDRGYICYRVRAIGRATTDLNKRIFGVWTDADKGTVDNVNYYFKNYAWHDTLNWQFSASYAEEGKKKEVVSFFDGSLRNRQMVTKINSDNNTIVGETIYDHQGRPAIQVLPTPVQDLDCIGDSATSLKYYHNFTQNQDSIPYSRTDFDVDDTTGVLCNVVADSMGTGNGAARYYSPDNPDQTDENAFIPDAELFPFTQVEYTPDNTGRIRRQGGVGEDFQLGSGHESKYYYGHPSQIQLDRMFGSEVGDKAHYQKNMVVDPNGQISVSYMDQEGRVIATSLAGDAPANLIALPSEASAGVELTEDLFAPDDNGNSVSNQLSIDGSAKTFTETMLIAGNTEVTFDYTIDMPPFTDSCLPEGLCFSCVYDLTIMVIDECGTDLVEAADTIIPTKIGYFNTNPETGAITFDLDCENAAIFDSDQQTFTLNLTTGSYQIVKTLRVNEAAKQFYIEQYMDTNVNTCIQSLEDFEQAYLDNTDFSDCNPETNCDSCLAALGTLEDCLANGGTAYDYQQRQYRCNRLCEDISECDVAKIMLMSDMSPGGQYAEFLAPDGTTNPGGYPLSILNAANILPFSYGSSQISWRNPELVLDGANAFEYRDEDGVTRSRVELHVTLDGAGDVIATDPEVQTLGVDEHYDAASGEYYAWPEDLLNVEDFRNEWQPSWANSLIVYHPEYPFYAICLEYEDTVEFNDPFTSNSFDSLLRRTDTWQAAVDRGFIESSYASISDVNLRLTNWFSSGNDVWDPFVVHSATYYNYGAELVSKFSVFTSMGANDYSMAQMAAMGVRCSNLVGVVPGVTCFRFGDDAVIGDPDYNDSIRDREWQALRAYYLSMKQSRQQQLAINLSITDPSYYGYNGCIGAQESFYPSTYDFNDNSLPLASTQYANPDQPCNYNTYPYYAYKVKRFPVSSTDINQDINNAAYQNYLLTGQCPLTGSLEHLLNEAAQLDTLTTASFLANGLSTFNGFYLALNDYYIATPVPGYEWNQVSMTSSQIIIELVDTFTMVTLGTVQIDIPIGLPAFTWSDVIGFSNLQSTGGTFQFDINALVDTTGGTMLVTLTGETSFDIDTCRFNEICTPNALAIELSVMMDALAGAGDLDATTAVQIKGGGSPYEIGAGPALQDAAYNAPASTLYWIYHSSSSSFRMYESNPATLRYELRIISYEPGTFNSGSIASIGGITAVRPTQGNTCEVICEDGSGNYLGTLNCVSLRNDLVTPKLNPVPLGTCDQPESVLCQRPAYSNTQALYLLLDDVISHQSSDDPGYNLFESDFMTTTMTTYFADSVVETESTTYDTVIGDIHYQITTIETGLEGCPIVLTLSDTLFPDDGLEIDSLFYISDIVLYGEPDIYGDYHQFYFLVEGYIDDEEVADTLFGTSCIPLNICVQCPDSLIVLEEDTVAMEEMMMMELEMGMRYVDPNYDSYYDYTKAIDSLNARMDWESSDSLFVDTIDYGVFAQNDMHQFAQTYLRFITNFDPDLDEHNYLVDPLLFAWEYGYFVNVGKEYDRYQAAVDRYNTEALSASLDSVALSEKPEFAYSKAADNLPDYVHHLTESIENEENAMNLNEFMENLPMMLMEEDSCAVYYDQYVDAYLYFDSIQDSTHSCPYFDSYVPLLSYSKFQDHNLCCSEIGIEILEDYIAILLSDTICPDPLPFLTDCEEPVFNDTNNCHARWLALQATIQDFNISPWATYHNVTMVDEYPYFSLFLASGKCICARSYNAYLYGYTQLDSTDVMPLPQTLKEFCDTSLVIPDNPCEAAYAQYLGCIAAFNKVAGKGNGITTTISYATFVAHDLCDCVDLYCSYLSDAIAGLRSFASTKNTSLFTICKSSTEVPCEPDLPIQTGVEFPTGEFADPCTEILTSIAYANAWNAYQDYLDSVSQSIGSLYQAHCMNAVETFTRTYMDKEYHRTLYYYDQAGNLVKTIPPEGVELLDITADSDPLADSIRVDRQQNTHFVLTSHRMETKYEYNSLNQLTRQVNPDQDKMDIWEITLPNGLYAGMNTTAIQMVSANRGYLSGYIELSGGKKRGLLYRTDNGGTNWSKVNNTVAAKLKRVEMATATVGFAVGEYGILLQTIDGGVTWDMLNLYGLGVTGELNDIIFTSSTAGLIVGNSTTMVQLSLSGSVATPTTATLVIPSALSGQTIQNIKSVTHDGSLYYFATTILNGSQTYDAILHCSSFATTTQADINGIRNKTIHYYSSTEGILVGEDGDIVKITTPSSGTTFQQTSLKSNLTLTAKQAYFMNASRGIALFESGSSTLGYYTLNGGENWLPLADLDGTNHLSLVKQTSTYIEVLAVGDDVATKRLFWNTTATEPSLLVNSQLIDPQSLNLLTATMVKDANGPTLILAGGDDGKIYFSNDMPSGTETAVYFEIDALSGAPSETAVKITVHRFATGAISGIILSSEGELYSIHRNAGASTFTISPAPITTGVTLPEFVDLAFDATDVRIYAYDNLQDKVHKMNLSATAAVTATSAYSTAATGIVAIDAIAVSNGRITIVGDKGEITTTNSLTGGGSLSTWSQRKALQATPINEISYSAGAHMAVGENGLVMYYGTGAVWTIKKRATTEDLYAAETVGSVELVVGSNGYAQTMTTSANGVPLMTVSGVPINSLLSDVSLRDIAADGDYTYIVGTNGTVLYSSDPATTAFNSTSGTYQHDFYGVAIPSGQSGTPKALVVGEQSVAYKFLMMNGNQQKGVFSDQLADVHFADLNAGSLVGKNFFVRQTTDGGMTWNIVRANNSVSTQLGATINKIWTVSSAYAIMGGVNYSSKIEDGLSDYTGFPTTMTDIQFSKANPLFGCLAGADGYLYSVTLTPSGGSYTGSGGVISGTPAGHVIKAVHIFENGNIMAVGADNFVGLWKGSWVDFSPTATTTPDPTFNDVFFHDDKVGYVVTDEGTILRSVNVTITPANHTITAIDFEVKNVIDEIIDDSADVNIQCIAFGSRYEGVWGGSYNIANITLADQEHTAYVRQIHDESDEFSSRFYYDRLGRIVVSQNSRQHAVDEYSYSLYDALGRVYEAGVKTENLGTDTLFADIFGATVGGTYIPSVINDDSLIVWLNKDSTTTRTEVTRSYYDETIIASLPVTFDPDPLTQRKRITHVSYEAVFDGDDQTYDHATHYDYDIHGNVKTLLQDNQKMSLLDVNIADQQFKRMDYHYDLISGNVHRVDYETGMADQWHHAYTYDADNRITEAYTTTTTPLMDPATGDIAAHNEPGMTPYWDKEVEYDYYKHGPLSRTQLGQEQVQGIDYVYTIQGWMKGVNSNTLYTDRDPGLDGEISSDNELVARDGYGYSLHYFEGDYAAIDAAKNVAIDGFTAENALDDANTLFNGNIAVMATTITNPNSRDVLPMKTIYEYDQLNRLKLAYSSISISQSNNSWATIDPIYPNKFNYDANGNILNQNRENEYIELVDSITYRYKLDANGKRLQNRLYHVREKVGSGDFGDDIDDQGTFYPDPADINRLNNYIYDAEGRLVKDRQERLDSILWRVDGKVLKIIRPDTSSRKNLVFDYDAMGRRIAKHVLSATDKLEHSTYYILDAQGNVISVYEREVDEMEESVNFYQAEKHIYGSARLGILNDSISLLGTDNDTYDMTISNHIIGKVHYELSNHLGNVLSVVSDKPIPYNNSGTVDYWLADIRSSQDYSPFGVTLSGRNFTLTGAEKGRYGFNGKEGDGEVKGEGNSYDFGARMYDSRLGRWFKIDNLAAKYPSHSSYCFTLNNPILYIDPDGNDVGFGNQLKASKKQTSAFDLANTSSLFNNLLLNYASSTKGDLKGTDDGILSKHQLNFNVEAVTGWGETNLYYKTSTGKWDLYDGKTTVDEKTEFKIDVSVTSMLQIDDFTVGIYTETFLHEILVHTEEITNILITFENEVLAANGDAEKMKSARQTLNESMVMWHSNNVNEVGTNTSEAHLQMAAGSTNLKEAAQEVIENLKKQLSNSELDKKTKKAISKKIAGIESELNEDIPPPVVD